MAGNRHVSLCTLTHSPPVWKMSVWCKPPRISNELIWQGKRQISKITQWCHWEAQSTKVAADGNGKLFTSVILLKAVIFMPKESIILVLRSCLLFAGTYRMHCAVQFFGVTVLNEHLMTLSLAECFRRLCNFPFLTWESIPCKMLNMPYKKESVFYVAFLFCIWCFHKHTSITLFLFETTAVPQWLA